MANKNKKFKIKNDIKIRRTWGIKPETQVKASDKVYKRNKIDWRKEVQDAD